jgi:hypothetical protein
MMVSMSISPFGPEGCGRPLRGAIWIHINQGAESNGREWVAFKLLTTPGNNTIRKCRFFLKNDFFHINWTQQNSRGFLAIHFVKVKWYLLMMIISLFGQLGL